MSKHIAVVGAGFSGAVLAQQITEKTSHRVTVFEAKDHVAGNCHTSRDPSTGIMLHHYGPHIFHTDKKEVWEYVNRFGSFGAFTNRQKTITARGVFSMPINLLTLNQFFDRRMTPEKAKDFVYKLGDKTIIPTNFEEEVIRALGVELYENFFYGYTKKQWGVDPKEIPASVFRRLPIRFDYNDNYYDHPYQGIPVDGYTRLIENILDDKNIHVQLNSSFSRKLKSEFDHVFYSGPVDEYFEYSEGPLSYRSLQFERIDSYGDFQGNAVITFAEESVPFTRIVEQKHFTPWESHESTVCFKEFSEAFDFKLGQPRFYPVRMKKDLETLRRYQDLQVMEKNVSFMGRLGTYRYLDMHQVIQEAWKVALEWIAKTK
jgi:UDP-galactopyranose mutase